MEIGENVKIEYWVMREENVVGCVVSIFNRYGFIEYDFFSSKEVINFIGSNISGYYMMENDMKCKSVMEFDYTEILTKTKNYKNIRNKEIKYKIIKKLNTGSLDLSNKEDVIKEYKILEDKVYKIENADSYLLSTKEDVYFYTVNKGYIVLDVMKGIEKLGLLSELEKNNKFIKKKFEIIKNSNMYTRYIINPKVFNNVIKGINSVLKLKEEELIDCYLENFIICEDISYPIYVYREYNFEVVENIIPSNSLIYYIKGLIKIIRRAIEENNISVIIEKSLELIKLMERSNVIGKYNLKYKKNDKEVIVLISLILASSLGLNKIEKRMESEINKSQNLLSVLNIDEIKNKIIIELSEEKKLCLFISIIKSYFIKYNPLLLDEIEKIYEKENKKALKQALT